MRKEGQPGGVSVWISVFEGVSADGGAGWEVVLLTKLRRFAWITLGKRGTNTNLLSYPSINI